MMSEVERELLSATKRDLRRAEMAFGELRGNHRSHQSPCSAADMLIRQPSKFAFCDGAVRRSIITTTGDTA
jgi:hypothetical protein